MVGWCQQWHEDPRVDMQSGPELGGLEIETGKSNPLQEELVSVVIMNSLLLKILFENAKPKCKPD